MVFIVTVLVVRISLPETENGSHMESSTSGLGKGVNVVEGHASIIGYIVIVNLWSFSHL